MVEVEADGDADQAKIVSFRFRQTNGDYGGDLESKGSHISAAMDKITAARSLVLMSGKSTVEPFAFDQVSPSRDWEYRMRCPAQSSLARCDDGA